MWNCDCANKIMHLILLNLQYPNKYFLHSFSDYLFALCALPHIIYENYSFGILCIHFVIWSIEKSSINITDRSNDWLKHKETEISVSFTSQYGNSVFDGKFSTEQVEEGEEEWCILTKRLKINYTLVMFTWIRFQHFSVPPKNTHQICNLLSI